LSLADLEAKYFESGPVVHSGNTEVTPIVDGVNYFFAIHDRMAQTTGAGDAIYILGWMFDAYIDILRPPQADPPAVPPPPGSESLGLTLAGKAAAGVDVRIVLNAAAFVELNCFGRDRDAADLLRKITHAGTSGISTPLAFSVLLDWSGAWSGSHHQKTTIVKAGNDMWAFVGGMDYWYNRIDIAPHNQLRTPSLQRWGWHDVGCMLHGEAVKDIWENFRLRWREARTLPSSLLGQVSNPAISTDPEAAPDLPVPAPTVSQSVQVLRSRFRVKSPRFWMRETPWDGPVGSRGGQYEVYKTLRKAIRAATTYIFIEDQFCLDSYWVEAGGAGKISADANVGAVTTPNLFMSLFPELEAAAQRNVRLIFVTSGRADPDDLFGGGDVINDKLNPQLHTLLANLKGTGHDSNLAVYRIDNVTVHAKLIIIDDEFASIGSANMHSRSMMGVDDELQVTFVEEIGQTSDVKIIRDLRVNLWAEHLSLVSLPDTVLTPLQVLPPRKIDDPPARCLSLGIWRTEWLPDNTDQGTWRDLDKPPGFAPTERILTQVLDG